MRPRAIHYITAAIEVIVIIILVTIFQSRAQALALNGTTLTANKTASGGWIKAFNWTISKDVTPSTWDLFSGDEGTSAFTVHVTKDAGRDLYYAEGSVCITNGGSVDTYGLAIEDVIEYKTGSGQYQQLLSTPLDLTAKPVLKPGESFCYPYKLVFDAVNGASYRNTANISILNHSGWLPGGNRCPGSNPCPFGPSPKADFSLPSQPVLQNDTIHVRDSNGAQWEFSKTDSTTYRTSYSCSKDTGTHTNTVTIDEPGQTIQSASANVTITCHTLEVVKSAETQFKRTYTWSVDKTANQPTIALALNQAYDVSYTVTASATPRDSDYLVSGAITITNPSPLSAYINRVDDSLSDGTTVTLDCGTTFPYLLAARQSLVCRYQQSLLNQNSLTNGAHVTLQNHTYQPDRSASTTITTDFSAQAPIDFSQATITEIDRCSTLTDSLQGSFGSICYSDIQNGMWNKTYTRTIGPYSTCGSRSIVNDISVLGGADKILTSDRVTVSASAACSVGCTLTIGYWKNHAGFGPQADMLTRLLPINLGTNGGAKTLVIDTASKAVDVISKQVYGTSSNGITKLYAQLLAAKLNVASGASASSIASTISAADVFLATTNYMTWSSLSKTQQSQVLKWHDTLDRYNNGLLTVPHCSE